ncbi:MAG TPA: efflux RND transporter periplasmic adaptor subunit [Chitinophagaceae bacterium]|nr:efflux RND transporter periplasmic adaptor subunit [Chitinophagaceae bacterium]
MSLRIVFLVLVAGFWAGCQNDQLKPDASGVFEAEQTIVSAQGNGMIEQFQVSEGLDLAKGEKVGYVDTSQLHYTRLQLEASIRQSLSQTPDISAQINVLEARLRQASINQERTRALFQDSAATRKELDEMNSNVNVLQKQITATRSQLETENRGLIAQTDPLRMEISKINDQINNSEITNPINGTVLNKYAELGEVTSFGKPLYAIADLDTLILRVYITGDQLPSIRLGQHVQVYIDIPQGKQRVFPGYISWISDQAEFTPKMIPTRSERAALVYAVKIRVGNDGMLKIGMPGDVKFNKP